MKAKVLERILSVLLLVVWVLLLLRAHALRPIAFYQLQPVLYVGDVAVLIVVVMSLTTRRPLLAEKKETQADVPDLKIEDEGS